MLSEAVAYRGDEKVARSIVERVVSDLSGKEIADGEAWTMTLTPPDGRRNPVRLDISEDEARQWLSKGTEVKRRGRRPGSTTTRSRLTAAASKSGQRRRKTKTAAANGRKRKTAAANSRRKRRTAA
jgi:hypothetical protein